MSGTVTPPLFQPSTTLPSDPHTTLSLILSLLSSSPSSPSPTTTTTTTAHLATARSLSRAAQASLLRAKAEVEEARLGVEDKQRRVEGLRRQRGAVWALAEELGRKDVQGMEEDPLYEGIISQDDFLRDGPEDVLAGLPQTEDPEYEPALLEARLRHHLAQIASRENEITSLEESLKAVRKENDALRKQHAVADHHLADLGRVADKVANALEQAEKLASQA